MWGVMEAIRISCAGYPTRKNFYEFVCRFGILAPEVLKGCTDEMTACKRLLDKVNLKDYQIGKTKVFLRAGQMAELDACRSEVLGRSASIIQRKVRTYFCHKYFNLLRLSAIQIQTISRGQLACHQYDDMRREAASVKIQKHGCMYLAKNAYKSISASAVYIQTGMRGMASRNGLRFRKKTKCAIAIQSHCRGYLARIHFLRIKKAAIATQCSWRGIIACRELRKLKMAAKETGALQAAKSKLEKEVEELSWRLQLEKRMRADIEEAQAQENTKLRYALQEMQLEFQETKALLIQECEAAKKVAEKAPIIQEELVNSLEKKTDETERKYEESNKLSEERLKQALEAETKIIELKTAMQRLEEKLSDMETEDQILRQQALLTSSSRRMSAKFSFSSAQEPHISSPAKKFDTEADSKMRRSQIEKQQESVDALIKCAVGDLGFSEGKPVAAYTIYKCLLQSRSFEAEKTSVFDRLIQLIGSAIEDQDNNDHMAYWLSNTSALLLLLQRSLRTNAGRKPPAPTSFFGRMTQGFRSSSINFSSNSPDVVHQIDAKYPALLFKQQLTAYLEKIYGIIRDNLKKDLSPLLSSCIQASWPFISSSKIMAPKTTRGSILKSPGQSNENSPQAGCWHDIIDCLNRFLNMLKENYVPPVLAQNIYTQVFHYINVQIFNSNGEFVKSGLAELEIWCGQATEEYAASSWDELKQVRQAVGFLVRHQKTRISYDDLTNNLCPVTSSLRLLMTDDANDDSNSFLLDDNSSIPISVDDISTSLEDKTLSRVNPPAELLENPAFQFLQD